MRGKKLTPDQLAALRSIRKQVEDSRKLYSRQWSAESTEILSQGAYDWMATQLGTSGLVLEIGCGNGASTLTLCRAGSRVVAVEEIPDYLTKSQAMLADAGVKVAVEHRGEWAFNDGDPGFGYPSTVTSAPPVTGALLIEGDIVEDELLKQWLEGAKPFDAIVCWNIGAHAFLVADKQGGDIQRYRLEVQNEAYSLAGKILRPGGVLHIVDRGTAFEGGDRSEFLKDYVGSHRDQAEGTPLEVDELSVAEHPYVPLDANEGIPLKQAGQLTNRKPMSFWSIRAIRP